jgi:hypothetical protein
VFYFLRAEIAQRVLTLGYGTKDLEAVSEQEYNTFLFYADFRSALWLTEPPV